MCIGHVQVYEDSCCADQSSHVRPFGKQSLRTSRAANLSSALENTNHGSFQVYEDSMQSVHGSMRTGGNKSGREGQNTLAVAEELCSGMCVAEACLPRLEPRRLTVIEESTVAARKWCETQFVCHVFTAVPVHVMQYIAPPLTI